MVVGARATIQVKPYCGSPTPNWPIFRGELATYSNLFSPMASREAFQANSDRKAKPSPCRRIQGGGADDMYPLVP
jgi:hypothetical protein